MEMYRGTQYFVVKRKSGASNVHIFKSGGGEIGRAFSSSREGEKATLKLITRKDKYKGDNKCKGEIFANAKDEKVKAKYS
jgi:hypothetical protein